MLAVFLGSPYIAFQGQRVRGDGPQSQAAVREIRVQERTTYGRDRGSEKNLHVMEGPHLMPDTRANRCAFCAAVSQLRRPPRRRCLCDPRRWAGTRRAE